MRAYTRSMRKMSGERKSFARSDATTLMFKSASCAARVTLCAALMRCAVREWRRAALQARCAAARYHASACEKALPAHVIVARSAMRGMPRELMPAREKSAPAARGERCAAAAIVAARREAPIALRWRCRRCASSDASGRYSRRCY